MLILVAKFEGKNYLEIIDYFPKWIEANLTAYKMTSELISKFKNCFTTFGIPKVLVADNCTRLGFSSYCTVNSIIKIKQTD